MGNPFISYAVWFGGSLLASLVSRQVYLPVYTLTIATLVTSPTSTTFATPKHSTTRSVPVSADVTRSSVAPHSIGTIGSATIIFCAYYRLMKSSGNNKQELSRNPDIQHLHWDFLYRINLSNCTGSQAISFPQDHRIFVLLFLPC